MGYESKIGHFKQVKKGFRSIGLWVGLGQVRLTRIFHMNFFYKENNMNFPFGKSCNKLLDVKYITLNSSLISRILIDIITYVKLQLSILVTILKVQIFQINIQCAN